MTKTFIREDDTFEFFVPCELVKSESTDKKDDKRWIQGIASTDSKDLQNEKVLQSGIDFSYFLKNGFFNDNHKETKVGEPVECRITEKGLWVKGFLYKGMERADYWWNFLNSLEQSGANRKVGFSIQGKVVRRSGNSITKCWLQHVAITDCPVNTDTWAEIVKSLSEEKFCSQPWQKSCSCCSEDESCEVAEAHDDECACKIKDKEDESKALSAGGMGRMMIPQSLEGSNKVTTYKSIEELPEIDMDQAVQYLRMEKGYSKAAAEAIADAIFINKGII